jgi:hypothetical protein
MAQGTRFLQDRAAAEEAWALANQVSIDRAARDLGVSTQALRRAFDEHGLGQPTVFQGGPPRSPFLNDRDAAERAWRRAAEVGINQTRKELGTSDKALRTAWARHGLGLPPRPVTPPSPTLPLDPVSVTLNQGQLPTPAAARPTRPHGCAATRRSRPWATARSSRSMARAASPPSGAWPPSPVGRSAPRSSPANASSVTSAAAPQRRAGRAGRARLASPPSSAARGAGGAPRWPLTSSAPTTPDPAARFRADLAGYLRGLPGPELATCSPACSTLAKIDLLAALAHAG